MSAYMNFQDPEIVDDELGKRKISSQYAKVLPNKTDKRFTSNTLQKGFFNCEDEGEFVSKEQASRTGRIAKKNSEEKNPSTLRNRRKGPRNLQPTTSSEAVQVFARTNLQQSNDKRSSEDRDEQAITISRQLVSASKPRKPVECIFFNDEDEEQVEEVKQLKPVLNLPPPAQKSKKVHTNELYFSEDGEEGSDQQTRNNESGKRGDRTGGLQGNSELPTLGSNGFQFTDLTKLKKQISSSLPQDKMIRMQILRDSSGLNTFWPEFHTYFTQDTRYLMSCKKTASKPTSTFIITCRKDNFEENNSTYLGKMKSNIMGDVLNVFGPGYNPANAKERKEKPRELLATIVYETSFFQAGKPREFTVYCLAAGCSYYDSLEHVEEDSENPLNQLAKYPQNKDKIVVYRNKQPFWKQEIGGYMLNFRGRVGRPSIKNFILEEVNESNHEVLLFGKASDSKFNMDISGPLSPMIGFAIALSSFDSRIMCE